jgi:cysteine desulfurase/selenocysteine lyase
MATDVRQDVPLSPEKWRVDFPILDQQIHRQRPLVFLDNAASTQRPNQVIDAMSGAYRQTYANVHRGNHWLSEQSTLQFEAARSAVARFLGSENPREVVFTSGTTAALNLVARAWGEEQLRPGDEILLTEMEHHSNIVPWQQVAARTGAVVRFVPIDAEGRIRPEAVQERLSERTRVFAFAAISNVLATVNPVADFCKLARTRNILTVVDAAQHVPHEPIDVRQWGADLIAFSGHKLLGPTGIGVLYGRFELLDSWPPFLGGGSMIDRVTWDGFTPGEVPARFEAGTPPIVEAIGLHAALDYLGVVGLPAIQQHERRLVEHAIFRLEREIDGFRLLGPREDRAGIVSFVIDRVHPQDLAIKLDLQGVAIRAGHHCAMPLHEKLGLSASCRASFYLYNTLGEVDYFVDAVGAAVAKLR